MLIQAAVLVGAYILGSIPFGFVVARALGIRDIRAHGSGNIGATNIMRTLGPLPAVVVLVLDVLKGALPVLAMRWAGGSLDLQALAGFVAMLGHNYPFTLGFRGGRGVATALGMILAVDPWTGLAGAVVFVLIVAATRYVSLGSMTGAAAAVVAAAVRGVSWGALGVVAVGAGFIIWRHRPNIQRLLAGTESRFGQRVKPPTGGERKQA